MEDILVPLGLFAMIAAIIVAPRYFKSQERRKLADTMRAAIEKGQPLPPEVVDALTQGGPMRASVPKSDLRRGVVWVAVAAGIILFGFSIGYWEPDAAMPFIGIAAIPLCVGCAFLVLAWLNRTKA